MKTSLKATLLALTLASTLSMPRTSEASISLLTLNGPLAIKGLATFLASGYAGATLETTSARIPAHRTLYTLSVIGFFVGAIILDGNQSLSFTELSEQDAAKLNLSSLELESFNAEVDQANALLAQAEAELSELSDPSLADSLSVWSTLKETVSPETFSVMQKITSQFSK